MDSFCQFLSTSFQRSYHSFFKHSIVSNSLISNFPCRFTFFNLFAFYLFNFPISLVHTLSKAKEFQRNFYTLFWFHLLFVSFYYYLLRHLLSLTKRWLESWLSNFWKMSVELRRVIRNQIMRRFKIRTNTFNYFNRTIKFVESFCLDQKI